MRMLINSIAGLQGLSPWLRGCPVIHLDLSAASAGAGRQQSALTPLGGRFMDRLFPDREANNA